MNDAESAWRAVRTRAGHGRIVLDENGRVIEFNETMEAWTGRTKKEMQGQTLEAIMAPEDWARHRPMFLEWITNPKNLNKTVRLPCRIWHKETNKPTTVEVNAIAVRPAGHPIRAAAFVDRERNITEVEKGETVSP